MDNGEWRFNVYKDTTINSRFLPASDHRRVRSTVMVLSVNIRVIYFIRFAVIDFIYC